MHAPLRIQALGERVFTSLEMHDAPLKEVDIPLQRLHRSLQKREEAIDKVIMQARRLGTYDKMAYMHILGYSGHICLNWHNSEASPPHLHPSC